MQADLDVGTELLVIAGEPVRDAVGALAVRAASGDGEAFDALLMATQRRVAALAFRFLGSREEARDATQEVYLRVYRSLKGFRPDQEFTGWLYRITTNVCRDHLKRRRSWLPLGEGSNEPALVDDIEGRAVDTERGALLRRALADLPPQERFALVLHDLEGRSTEEVARMLGIRAVTVRSQLCSARKRLRALFEQARRKP